MSHGRIDGDGRVARLLELSDAHSRVTVAPALGGGLAGFDSKLADGLVPVLRNARPGADAFGLANNVLIPFSNRISGGGFNFGEAFHAVPCNIDGQEFPAHGDAFLREWEVLAATGTSATLSLPDGGIGPFRYAAELTYALENGTLLARVRVTNTGSRLPFGGGFHPWFPRREGTGLAFDATHVWLEDARHLPTEQRPIEMAADFDFRRLRALPRSWINNAYTGWRGSATVLQPELGLSVEITAPDMDVAIVFSPDGNADFFCFEPVTHAVDAFNQQGMPGLRVLEPGAEMAMEMRIAWRTIKVGAARKP
nr:aldose 1-epimerase [Nitratireductor luteus]